VAVLEVAEAWHVLPWEFAGGSPLKWYLRFMALRREKMRVLEEGKANG